MLLLNHRYDFSICGTNEISCGTGSRCGGRSSRTQGSSYILRRTRVNMIRQSLSQVFHSSTIVCATTWCSSFHQQTKWLDHEEEEVWHYAQEQSTRLIRNNLLKQSMSWFITCKRVSASRSLPRGNTVLFLQCFDVVSIECAGTMGTSAVMRNHVCSV